MKLIIAEKPSLARNIVQAINPKMSKHDGYMSDDSFCVTWAFGHLFSLEDVEHYSPSGSGKWTMDNIPCFPEHFDYSLKKDKNGEFDKGIVKQFNIISSLCNRKDVEAIINAGDADREGEIIVRLCIEKSGCKVKNIKRLWLTDQTPETINSALSLMNDDSEYDNLASEGFARTYTDWLYGINLSRYATLRSGMLLRVGRVIVPIVQAIYERDAEIENFVPETYFVASSKEKTNGEIVELVSKEKFKSDEKDKCNNLCSEYNNSVTSVKSIKKKKTIIGPGKLYSLSTLQNFLGKKYKMSMSDSLNIIQDLYEKGFLTYPRTNSEYLTENEKGRIASIIKQCNGLGYDLELKHSKNIFDDSKVESHTAITPTGKIPQKNSLSDKEYTVYSTVFKRFAAVFCKEDCVADKTEIVISTGNLEEFTLKGTVIVNKGWTKYDDYNQKDKILPMLSVGEVINTDFGPTEKKTAPPKHYTIETLNNFLKNPFKNESKQLNENESDEEDYKAMFDGLELGTEATRTGIIDNARKSNYILLTKDIYTILPDGKRLVETLRMLSIDMDKYKTAYIGKSLKKIYKGESDVPECIEIVKKEIAEIFKSSPEKDYGFYNETIGKCPVCGQDVKRGRYNYKCSGEGCQFKINLDICNKVISVSHAKELLTSGKTSKICGFISKRTGKTFDAFLKLDEEKNIIFEFK